MTDDLLHRLAAAPEGSREPDAEIFCRVQGTVFRRIEHGHKVCFLVEGVGHDVWTDLKHVPHYTTSLDAAMLLVPEGWWWSLMSPNGFEPYTKYLFALQKPNADNYLQFEAATPALALCIAALKAKEQSDE